MAKKYVSLSKLSTFLDNLKNLFATKSTVDDLSTNVAYINTTDNETVTDTETSSASVIVDSYLSDTSTNPVQNKVITKKINELSQAIESNAKIDVTAEVGQTIVVKAVDENGKPTAWESADYQPRTHWTEIAMAELLPETTIAIYPEMGQCPYMKTIGLLTGQDYLVRWNGTEYNCTAQDMYMPIDDEGNIANIGVTVGNAGVMMGEEGTGEPFIILEFTPECAAAVDGIPACIVALDGSESVTLTINGEGEIVHKLDGAFLPEGTPYLEPFDDVVLEETVISDVIVTMNGGFAYLNLPLQNNIVVGNIYEVNIGDSTYSLKACPVIDDENCYAALGSGCILAPDTTVPKRVTGMPYSNAPFILMFYTTEKAQEYGFNAAITGTSEEVLVRMTIRCVYKPNKIDDNCLPDISMPLVVKVDYELNEYVPRCTWSEAYCAALNGRPVFLNIDTEDVYSLSYRGVSELRFGRIFFNIYQNSYKVEQIEWHSRDGITLTSKEISV